jgi:dihydroorotate dehydrogenase (fumarate)
MADLTTKYLGLTLNTPLVASSSPVCRDVVNIRKLSEAGVGAVVLHSLFEEQIDIESAHLERALAAGETAEFMSYFPDMTTYNIGPDGYLEHIRKLKRAIGIPIIGSLNGVSLGGWLRYAKMIEHAGADALELNLYDIPSDPELPGAIIEERYCDIVTEIRSQLRIPLAVKIGPYFSSIPDMVRRLEEAGADGVVIFNRFYQPDFDLECLHVLPQLALSNPQELLLRLHWAALLYGNVGADIAITGGVHSAVDIVKSMMAGARVAMATSMFLIHGVSYAKQVISDLNTWLDEHEYTSIRQMQGAMSARKVSDPSAFERANYMKVLGSFSPVTSRT